MFFDFLQKKMCRLSWDILRKGHTFTTNNHMDIFDLKIWESARWFERRARKLTSLVITIWFYDYFILFSFSLPQNWRCEINEKKNKRVRVIDFYVVYAVSHCKMDPSAHSVQLSRVRNGCRKRGRVHFPLGKKRWWRFFSCVFWWVWHYLS